MKDTNDMKVTNETSVCSQPDELLLSRRRLLQGMTVASIPIMTGALSGCGSDSVAATSSSSASSSSSSSSSSTSAVTITTQPFKVAIVGKAASTQLNLAEGIDKLISLMQDAKANGALLLACGELWLPGYPVQLNFQNDWKAQNWANYVANSITIGDANWQTILAAAQSIGIHVSFGFSEIAGNYAYMTQALIDDTGQPLIVRRKVRPSGGERNYWSDATMDNLKVVTTTLGRIGMLECWDHLRPQSTFNMMAQAENIHICAWPYISATTSTTQWWEREEVALAAAAYYSQLTGAITIMPAVGRVGVFSLSQQVAGMAADDPADMLYYTVTPNNWTGQTGSATSEFSWGVLQLIANNYPGDKVADADHGVLNMVPLS